jgi:ABC-type branched-subunit amino acid transport system ATPase component/ABC-type branched-subunit amino acid transport system permease subunit
MKALALIVAFAAAIAFTATANSYYVFIMATLALTAIAGVGLNVLLGLTGQVSFGHVGFYALGAYTVAVLTVAAKWSFWAAAPVAALVAGATGALLALPAMRVRGPYLAMVTIAFGFVVENLAVEWRSVTGGQNGIMGVPQPAVLGLPFGERGVAIAAIMLAAAATYGFHLLSKTKWGAAMRAVKDSEVAAESIGLDPLRIKTAAFAISAVCAGLAGALFAPLSGFVTPSTFSFSQSLLFVLVVIIGGAGSLAGPLVGAAIVVLLPEALAALAEYRLLFFGALLLGVLWLAPDGVTGLVTRLTARRRKPRTVSDSEVPLAPAQRATLQVEHLGIAFGGVRAANEVSLRAEPGKVTSLIGPNGAGKTTVLNMLSGFYRPDAGSIRIGDRELQGAAAWRIARAGVARTYQTTLLFSSMTVAENLTIAGGGDELLSFVNYKGDINARAADLPHVDKRLVEIARALATGPSVLLLDEPAAGLSRQDKERLARLLRRIADSGVAVVLVEHDMEVVMGISDTVVVLDAGVVIAAGAPAEVQRDPAVRKAYLGEQTARAIAPRAAAEPGAPYLQVGRLAAGYGAEPVLKGVELQVRERELVAVLGANGAGKSTLMRAISGLLRPVQGGIAFGGEDITGLPAHRVMPLGLVLVPEGRQVFPELSVLHNLELGAFGRRGAPQDAVAGDIETMLERFPRLRERLHQRAGLLSGGEQQMLAIARGLMGRPKMLLLDEPSLGLAPAVINDLFAALDRLRAESATILLVDQMAGLALALADHAYVIEGGRIVASGAAQEIAADGSLEKAYLAVN